LHLQPPLSSETIFFSPSPAKWPVPCVANECLSGPFAERQCYEPPG
jgi:hypothetical protein